MRSDGASGLDTARREAGHLLFSNRTPRLFGPFGGCARRRSWAIRRRFSTRVGGISVRFSKSPCAPAGGRVVPSTARARVFARIRRQRGTTQRHSRNFFVQQHMPAKVWTRLHLAASAAGSQGAQKSENVRIVGK